MIMGGDVLLILSNSGSTPELQTVVRHVKSLGCKIIGITSRAESPLMQVSDVQLVLPAVPEACPSQIAPTTSTTLMLALGDALAIAVMEQRGLTRDHLRLLHPGGTIGNRLIHVDDIMHAADQLPLVDLDLPMQDVVIEMTRRSLGIAGVVNESGQLVGVITDGDLRRHIDHLFTSCAADVMTADPKTIEQGTYVEDALTIMQASLITSLFVVDRDQPRLPVGLVHIHDFSRIGRR
jgi:arabinose-5-phosphate isomerase